MSKTYTNDGVLLIDIMRKHLNKWPDKPATVKIEDFDRDTPSMMIQQLAAAEKRSSYINGSYVGAWTFAVYIRVAANDTATRLDALRSLTNLYYWLSQRDDSNDYSNLPYIDDNRTATRILLLNNPSVAAKYDNGIEDYQAVLELDYNYSERR